jgi:uroporphyrinogen-III synthase
MKIKNILVSQPTPVGDASPYFELAKKEKIKIDFRPFIKVEGVSEKELRVQKIDLSHYTGVIFTSKNAVDHYFRLAEEMRFSVPDTMRYICQVEAIANYLQKHVVYRKRKISFGEKTAKDMLPLFKKYPADHYLLPSSDILNQDVPDALNEADIKWTRAVMYRTVCDNLTDVDISQYDMLVFFSPQGIKSLLENFPHFVQGETKIAAFGTTTQAAAKAAGLEVNIEAPTKESPSMTMALERFIKVINKNI